MGINIYYMVRFSMILKIDEGTVKVSDKEFFDEGAFTEVIIPESVKSIGEMAFSVYTTTKPTLEKFTVDETSNYFKAVDGVLLSKTGDKLVAFPMAREGVYSIPDGVKVIGKYAFRMCINITEIIIPDSVEKIEKGAFYYCKALKKLTIGNGCKLIGAGAFEACENLSEIILGDNIEKIQKKAFIKCGECKEIILPKNLKTIEAQAFYGINNTKYVFSENIQAIADKAFVGKNVSVYAPEKLKPLLRPEIFAMNDVRKYNVPVHFIDSDDELVIKGKLGDKYIKPPKDIIKIKPELIEEIEGSIIDRFPRCMDKYLALYFDETGDKSSAADCCTEIAVFTPQGIRIKSLENMEPQLPLDFNYYLDYPYIYKSCGNSDYVHKRNSYIVYSEDDIRDISSTTSVRTPQVYSLDDENLVLDLSYTELIGDNVSKCGRETFVVKKKKMCYSYWKININSDEATEITGEEFKKYQLRRPFQEYDKKAKSYLKRISYIENESNADRVKRKYKDSYGDFMVPDSEESMDRFFVDDKGNIFNYGFCAVYNKNCKCDIESKCRAYINMYSPDGVLKAVIKFKGAVQYLLQRDDYYYVCTQKRKTSKDKSILRWYRFKV